MFAPSTAIYGYYILATLIFHFRSLPSLYSIHQFNSCKTAWSFIVSIDKRSRLDYTYCSAGNMPIKRVPMKYETI